MAAIKITILVMETQALEKHTEQKILQLEYNILGSLHNRQIWHIMCRLAIWNTQKWNSSPGASEGVSI
jgi:hypothetical protein